MLYVIRNRKTGTVLSINFTLRAAQKELARYERIDHDFNQYVPNFYEIAKYDCVEVIE